MVINYKRLSDNTENDGYDIPTKECLLGKIKNCNIFRKFDYKSGFWQVKMHQDSIPRQLFHVQKDILNGWLCHLV